MLTIRMQRKGRTGHAQFRVIVQDSRFSPSSGRVVAYVGSYNPHTKDATLDGEKISKYLDSGAQPSDRVAKLLTKEGIKLPAWFTPAAAKKGTIRHPEKRRSTRPEGAEAPVIPEPAEPEAPTAETIAEPAEAIEPAEVTPPADETAAEAETPADPSTDMSSEALAKDEAPAEVEETAEPAPGPKPEEPAEEAPKT